MLRRINARQEDKETKIIHLTGPLAKHMTEDNSQGAYYNHSWAATIAKRTKLRFHDLDIETWRTDWHVDNISLVIEEGVSYRQFPMKKVLFNKRLSWEMIKMFNSLSREHNLIINYHDVMDILAILLPLVIPKARIVLFHHGGLPPSRKSLSGLIKRLLFAVSCRSFSYITYLNQETKSYLESHSLNGNIGFLPVGADYSSFCLIPKKEARAKLSYDQEAVYALAVGPVSSLKGADLICDVYLKLKAKYNLKMVYVGPMVQSELGLFERMTAAGVILPGRVTWSEMHLYYTACDFFVHPVFSKSVGFDVSLLEALASDRPVISTKIDMLDGSAEDIGIQLSSADQLESSIEQMINNYPTYSAIRDKTIGIYNANSSVIDRILDIYTTHCGMIYQDINC